MIYFVVLCNDTPYSLLYDWEPQPMLYELTTQREILPVQHFLIQGFPVPGFAPAHLAKYFPYPSFVSLADTAKSRGIRNLTGDCMHWASIGAMLSFAFACGSYKSEAGSDLAEALQDPMNNSGSASCIVLDPPGSSVEKWPGSDD